MSAYQYLSVSEQGGVIVFASINGTFWWTRPPSTALVLNYFSSSMDTKAAN